MSRRREEPPYPPRPFVPASLVAMVCLVVAMNVVLRGVVDARAVIGSAGAAGVVAGCAAARRRGALPVRCRRWSRVPRLLAFLWTHRLAGGPERVRRLPLAPLILVSALAVLAGGALAGHALAGIDEAARELARTSVSALELVVEGDASPSASGWLWRAEAHTPGGLRARVWVTSSERPALGERLRAVGRFDANKDDEWGRSSRSRGLCGRVRVVRVTRREGPEGLRGVLARLRTWVVGRIDPARSDARALMAGVLAADRGELKARGVEEAFSTAGLAHLVAVSGSHLAVVGACFETLLAALGCGPAVRGVGVTLVCGAYVLFCASPTSAVRSWAMLAAARGGRALGRRAHALSGMALTGLTLCILDPFCACDLGFLLSTLSVCALALFSGHMEAVLARLAPRGAVFDEARAVTWRRAPRLARRLAVAARGMRSTLAATLVCQLATLPACAVTFGTASLVAPLANVAVGPLLGPIVTAGVVGCALSWVPFVGDAVLAGCAALCAVAVGLVRLLAAVPLASVPVALGPAWELAPLVVSAALLVWWPMPSRRHLLGGLTASASVGLALTCGLFVLVPPRVIVLDVGQGDAILVRDGPRALLVDTGPPGAIAQALARQHVLALDAVVLTHLHDDHTGGLDELGGLLRVGAVYVAEGVSAGLPARLADAVETLTGSGAEELAAGDALRLGGFELTCLWPRAASDGSENEDSLCLRLSYERRGASLAALLTGDAERDVLARIAPAAGDVDLLKVGHHGSAVSVAPPEARALAAEVAVASAGEGNSYGHPRRECVEVLEDAGSTVLCTIETGDVTVEPGPAGPRVSCSGGALAW